MTTAFSFDYDLFSDLHKDAYGVRPRTHFFYDDACSDELRQQYWDQAIQDLDDRMEEEARELERAIERFKSLINVTIGTGAKDMETALRWLVQSETFYSKQDVEQWVWEHGILFSDYGRFVVEKVDAFVEYKEFEWL